MEAEIAEEFVNSNNYYSENSSMYDVWWMKKLIFCYFSIYLFFYGFNYCYIFIYNFIIYLWIKLNKKK